MKTPFLSIICPAYNEGENITRLYSELKMVLEHLPHSYEILMVDDGSTDDTRQQLKALAARGEQLMGIFLTENRGQSFAMKAGIDQAQGELLIFLDADLQNVPADIPRLLQELEKGYELVCGWRTSRKDALFSTTLPSQIGNWLIRKLFGLKLHDTGCTLKVVKAEWVKNISYFKNFHRYIPVMLSFEGARMTEIPVQHRPRIHGSSKYSIWKVFGVVKELIYLRFFYK